MYKYEEREPYYLELLANFGLKQKEAKVYFASLRLGQATVSKIAKEANVERSFVYLILYDLVKRGLVSSMEIRGKKQFRAISIESLRFLFEEKFERFKGFIPELKGLEKSIHGQNVSFFEGREGILAILEDTLNQPPGSEILCYINVEGFWTKEHTLGDWYVKERIKRKISMRMIAPDNPETIWYVEKDKKHKRETQVVPADKFPFTAEIEVYGNKISIIDLHEGELVGVIIESEGVAKTQRMIFELAWLGAKMAKAR